MASREAPTAAQDQQVEETLPAVDSGPGAYTRRTSTLWALLGSALLAAIFARAALLNLNKGVVGGDLDGYENVWNYWWVKTALLDLHRNPFFTDYIYYPTGISLRYATLNLFNGLLTMPFNLTLGYIPTINLLFFVALTLNCFFAFLLLRDLVTNAWAAFAGAALYAFANYMVVGFFQAGQANMISGQWLPLYLFFLFRALHGGPQHNDTERARSARRQWLYVALSVAALVVMSLTDWQYVMFAVFTTLLYFLFVLFTRRTRQEKARIFGILAATGGAYTAIVALPLVIPMIQEAAANPWLSVGYQSGRHSVDILYLLGPGLGNPGYIAVALALLGLWAARRAGGRDRENAAFWGLCALFFYAMTLGPNLIFNDLDTPIPMPYRLLQDLPVFNIGRDPRRFNIVATLGVGILAAFGLRYLASRFPLPRLRVSRQGVGFGIAGLFMAASLTPFMAAATNPDVKVDPPRFPDLYRQIASDPGDYTIFELPPFTEKGMGEDHYMMYQIMHGKPRYSGRWARDHKLTNPNNFVKRASLFRHLWLLDYLEQRRRFYFPDRDFLQRTDYSTQGLAVLNYYKVRYLVLYKDALNPGWNENEFQQVMGQVLGHKPQPDEETDLVRVYRIPDAPVPPTNPLTLDAGEGWSTAEVRSSDNKVFRLADSTNGQAAELYTMNLSGEPLRATLRFTAYAIKQPRTLKGYINGYEVLSVALNPEDPRQTEVDLTVPPGNNLITFASPEPSLPPENPETDTRPLSFGMYDVSLNAK